MGGRERKVKGKEAEGEGRCDEGPLSTHDPELCVSCSRSIPGGVLGAGCPPTAHQYLGSKSFPEERSGCCISQPVIPLPTAITVFSFCTQIT